jgi:glycosyltransferase 2 family protein
MNPSVRRWVGLGLRILFGIAGPAFLAVAFRETWDRSRQHVLPSPWHLAIAELLVLGALAFAASAWASLFEGHQSDRVLARGFYTAQLGKYMPGAIWQAVGQVALARHAGIPLSRASAAFPVSVATQTAAGGTVAAVLIFVGSVPLGVRLGSVLGLLLVLPLRRKWMVGLVRFAGRLIRRPWPEDLIPSQRGIVRSYGEAVGSMLMGGLAFALLASSLHASSSFAAAVPAFALAWTAGFLAIPFPSGIGVREAVLIATLGPGAGVAPVIAASLAQRVVTMVGEVVMILVARVRASRTE